MCSRMRCGVRWTVCRRGATSFQLGSRQGKGGGPHGRLACSTEIAGCRRNNRCRLFSDASWGCRTLESPENLAPHEHDAAGQCDAARPAKNLVRRPSRMARLGQPDCCTQHTPSYSQENIREPFALPLLHLFFYRVTFQNSQRGIVNIITPPIFCNTAALSTSPAVACCANARRGVEAKASLCGEVARVGRGCVHLF